MSLGRSTVSKNCCPLKICIRTTRMKSSRKTISSFVIRMSICWKRNLDRKTTFTTLSSAATSRISNPNAIRSSPKRSITSLMILSISSNGQKALTSRSNSETTSISFTSNMPHPLRGSRKKLLVRKKLQEGTVMRLCLNVMTIKIQISIFRKGVSTIFTKSPSIYSIMGERRTRTTSFYEILQ